MKCKQAKGGKTYEKNLWIFPNMEAFFHIYMSAFFRMGSEVVTRILKASNRGTVMTRNYRSPFF
jgi:hypothetical protein